jgi:hypothetical protein
VAPAVIEVPIFDTPVAARIGVPAQRALSECHIVSNGRMVRYFINQPSFVSVEILGANGRIVKKIPGSRCDAGWHPISLTDLPRGGANGVYFVRLKTDGGYQLAKRIIVIR